MNYVHSKDGTTIAYDKYGSGPAVILVCGGSVDRGSNLSLAEELSKNFTVYNYDRRGRGDSSDTLPYAIDREIEDIEAVADEAGGAAYLYGISSGAALALHTASKIPTKITKVALYEVPYIVDDSHPMPSPNTAEIFNNFIKENRRSDALEYFMANLVGLPAEFVAQAKASPYWAFGEKLAHTLAYDATAMGDYHLPTDLAASITIPTIVIVGTATWPFLISTGKALSEAIPNAEYAELEGQTHQVDPASLAPVLTQFFNS
ncbi:MAG: alpha/beta hydrolase [Chloroflexia bacterium]